MHSLRYVVRRLNSFTDEPGTSIRVAGTVRDI